MPLILHDPVQAAAAEVAGQQAALVVGLKAALGQRIPIPAPMGFEGKREVPVNWQPAEVIATPAVPVYDVPLERLKRGSFLRAARPSGLRYFILSGQSLLGAATVTTKNAAAPEMASYQEGPLTERMMNAITKGEELVAGGKDFELRLLDIRSLHFAAVWLYRKSEDILIPLNGFGQALDPVKPMASLKILRARLREGRALLDEPSGE